MAEKLRSYGTARTIFSILEFVSWVVVFIGIVLTIVLVETAGRYASDFQIFLFVLAGGGVALFGILTVAGVQVARATVDSAEYSQQSLQVARESLEVSRQSLKQAQQDRHSFAALKSDLTDRQKDNPSAYSDATATKPSASQVKHISGEPAVYRGERIRMLYGSYKAMGKSFANYEEAQAAIDAKLDGTALEHLSEPVLNLETQPELQAMPTYEETVSYAEARAEDTKNKASSEAKQMEEPSPARFAQDQLITEVAEPVATKASQAPTEPSLSKDTPTPPTDKRIKERDGKYHFGRMSFSSLEAAERYANQMGVNPNYTPD